MSAPIAPRVLQFTWPKCGSQWVRDVLTAPEMVARSGTSLHESSDNAADRWGTPPAGTFLGPVYCVTRDDWRVHRADTDKAVVVKRDLREVIVSLMHSVCYSHAKDAATDRAREYLAPLSDRLRLLWAIDQIAAPSWTSSYASWQAGSITSSEYVTTYEALINDPVAEFQRIVEFLNWPVPPRTLADVVDRLSFRERSGREPGQENVFSHYRRGQAGDWRRFFDRALGVTFEAAVPGLIVAAGYDDEEWVERLPERIGSDRVVEGLSDADALIKVRAEVVRLREENARLRKGSPFHRALRAVKRGISSR